MADTFVDEAQPLLSDSLQSTTLAVATLLMFLRADWGGALILCCGLGSLGQAVALAASVVGAACLSIEPDPNLCRVAMRAGACDFYVNTVDEALRVLKNEVRKRQPLSVALELDTADALTELLDRGVLPELFTVTPTGSMESISLIINHVQSYGMAVLDLSGTSESIPGAIDGPQQLQSLLAHHNLKSRTETFDTAAALRAFDTRLQAHIPVTDPRHRWLTAAPRLFHRDRPYRRVVVVTPEELAALT